MSEWKTGTLDLEEGPYPLPRGRTGHPAPVRPRRPCEQPPLGQGRGAPGPRFRCILPDLPLGSHPEPMKPGADISPVGIARIVGR